MINNAHLFRRKAKSTRRDIPGFTRSSKLILRAHDCCSIYVVYHKSELLICLFSLVEAIFLLSTFHFTKNEIRSEHAHTIHACHNLTNLFVLRLIFIIRDKNYDNIHLNTFVSILKYEYQLRSGLVNSLPIGHERQPVIFVALFCANQQHNNKHLIFNQLTTDDIPLYVHLI